VVDHSAKPDMRAAQRLFVHFPFEHAVET
jgi:hypothetical protein